MTAGSSPLIWIAVGVSVAADDEGEVDGEAGELSDWLSAASSASS
jgi:hypothetical protein